MGIKHSAGQLIQISVFLLQPTFKSRKPEQPPDMGEISETDPKERDMHSQRDLKSHEKL